MSSLAFFERLVRSRLIVGRLVGGRYPVPDVANPTSTLVDIFAIVSADSIASRNAAVEILSRNIRTEFRGEDWRNPVWVTAASPMLAATIGRMHDR